MEVGSQSHAPAALPSGKKSGTHFTGGWVGPRTSWTYTENLVPTGIRSPDLGLSEIRYTKFYSDFSFQFQMQRICICLCIR